MGEFREHFGAVLPWATEEYSSTLRVRPTRAGTPVGGPPGDADALSEVEVCDDGVSHGRIPHRCGRFGIDDHRPGGGYQNPWPDSNPRGFSHLVRWFFERNFTNPPAPDPPRTAFDPAAPPLGRRPPGRFPVPRNRPLFTLDASAQRTREGGVSGTDGALVSVSAPAIAFHSNKSSSLDHAGTWRYKSE